MSIHRLLIANRGEIACRIIRTARALGIETVAVYSDVDAAAKHVALADQAVRIGPAPASESYLVIDAILQAAQQAGADAVHPGYGFLSENATFARASAAAGLIFVGPPASAIEAMGDKAAAKRAMLAAGVPCIPGYQGEDQSPARLKTEAEAIGLPLMVKAAAGGGGRGMRLVTRAAELEDAITRARSEAESAFGSGDLILEKALTDARHVEIQVFADTHGNSVHMGERDCSVQRRHQKIIEEAPSPAVGPALRAKMGTAAVRAAQAVDYVGAGTVEFLLDRDGSFYFLEMNTRLQVEHPVTEAITGLDLVALQLRVAAGAPLGLAQDDVRLDGHAIEIRLYAEDPAADFLPATGAAALWHPPAGSGIRVDDGIRTGDNVSPFYDPMVAKVIAHGTTRQEARQRLIKALGGCALFGPANNRDFLIDVLGQPGFAAGDATTAFLQAAYPGGYTAPAPDPRLIAAAAVIDAARQQAQALRQAVAVNTELLGWSSAHALTSPFDYQLGGAGAAVMLTRRGGHYEALVDGAVIPVEIAELKPQSALLTAAGVRLAVQFCDQAERLFIADGRQSLTLDKCNRLMPAGTTGAADGAVTAPMHGQLIALHKAEGDRVTAGEPLAVLEAMKMQHQITAPVDGEISAVHVTAPAQLAAGDAILDIMADMKEGEAGGNP